MDTNKKMQDLCHLLCTLKKLRLDPPLALNLSMWTFVGEFVVYGLNDSSSELFTLCAIVFIGVTLTT